MEGYARLQVMSVMSALIEFDLTENKKTLGHGKRGAETSKEQGTISSNKPYAFEPSFVPFALMRRSETNHCGMERTLFSPRTAPGAVNYQIVCKKRNPLGITGQKLSVAELRMLVGYIYHLILTPVVSNRGKYCG